MKSEDRLDDFSSLKNRGGIIVNRKFNDFSDTNLIKETDNFGFLKMVKTFNNINIKLNELFDINIENYGDTDILSPTTLIRVHIFVNQDKNLQRIDTKKLLIKLNILDETDMTDDYKVVFDKIPYIFNSLKNYEQIEDLYSIGTIATLFDKIDLSKNNNDRDKDILDLMEMVKQEKLVSSTIQDKDGNSVLIFLENVEGIQEVLELLDKPETKVEIARDDFNFSFESLIFDYDQDIDILLV